MHPDDNSLLIAAFPEYGILRNQMAYVLATMYDESACMMNTIHETHGDKFV